MSKAKKTEPFVAEVKVTQDAPSPKKLPPHVYEALVINTGKGAGLLIEPKRDLAGVNTFCMTHIGATAQISVGVDGAKALRIILDQWILDAEQAQWAQVTEWRLAK